MMEERLKSHYESLSRAISFTRVADTKAAPVIALHVALLAALASQTERLWPIFSQIQGSVESCILAALTVVYLLCALSAITLAANVYLPRHPKNNGSLIYFEDIAASPVESFVERAQQMDTDGMERQLLDQVHTTSKIASVKMRCVRWTYYLSAPAIVLWVVIFGWVSI